MNCQYELKTNRKPSAARDSSKWNLNKLSHPLLGNLLKPFED